VSGGGFLLEAGAEDGGADADDGGAFLDGDGEVVAHAHGEFGKGDAGLDLELVAEFSEGGEAGAGDFGIGIEGGDGHEAVDVESFQGEEVVDLFAELGRGEAVFGGFSSHIDFEVDVGEAAEFTGDAVGLPGEFEGIDAVEGIKEGEGFADFVFLEVADEVPFEVGGEEGDFFDGFLNAIFAEEGVSGVDGFLDDFGGPGLGNDHEIDVIGLAAGLGGGLGDEIFYMNNVIGDV
jgi:hypothetical protein